MARHQDKNFSFDVPNDWEDRSIVAYAEPVPSGSKSAVSIIVDRHSMREGDTLSTHADRHLVELSRRLPKFELLESRDTQVGGVPAVALRYTWASPAGVLEQCTTLVERPTEAGRTVFGFTSTVDVAGAERARAMVAQILQSVRFEAARPPAWTASSEARDVPIEAPIVPMPGVRGSPTRR